MRQLSFCLPREQQSLAPNHLDLQQHLEELQKIDLCNFQYLLLLEEEYLQVVSFGLYMLLVFQNLLWNFLCGLTETGQKTFLCLLHGHLVQPYSLLKLHFRYWRQPLLSQPHASYIHRC